MSNYSLAIFEPLHNIHDGLTKLVKQCRKKYLLSDRTKNNGNGKEEKSSL